MTDDYRLIVPLMAGVVASLLVAEWLHPGSIYTLKLSRRGIHLKHGLDVDVMEAVRVEEVMVTRPATVPANLPVKLLEDRFLQTGRHGFPVLNEDGSLLGIVSLTDHRRALTNEAVSLDQLMVSDIATREVVTALPGETVGTALRRMAPRDLSRLPVVAPDNPRRLLGVVRRNDIVRAYEVGVVRREETRRRAEAPHTVGDARTKFVDMSLGSNAAAVGKTVAELTLPRETVLVSIRRGRRLLIPHGDTRLEVGDVVTALCEQECIPQLKAVLGELDDTASPLNSYHP
jgi:CIC family chloride channel protein